MRFQCLRTQSKSMVTEIQPSDVIKIDEQTVTCCENTHYRSEDAFGQDGYLSLSLRFDLPDRSVVFTGDTGPYKALETLTTGADLIVGEMTDEDITMQRVRAGNPHLPEDMLQMIHSHIATHHINPEELGALATTAGVKEVVPVHLSLTGPWELRDDVRNAIIEAGQAFGITLVGSGAYL